jgi:hypothetical protein
VAGAGAEALVAGEGVFTLLVASRYFPRSRKPAQLVRN